MVFEKASALQALTLCEEAYTLANTGQCVLPEGFAAPVAIRLPATGRPSLLNHDNLDIFGFVTAKDGVMYVVFRGTQILSGLEFAAEWLLDALSLPMAKVGMVAGNVHLGFSEAWGALRQSTMAAIQSFKLPATANRVITGHSLGAAIATLCWADLGGDLLTLAGPRVGDVDFARLYGPGRRCGS